MFRNKSVDVHQFAMVPSAQIPRSQFRMQTTHKTTFDGGFLIPIFCEEILPGDSYNVKMTCFARLATPVVPVMDNLTLESFFFFVPSRLVWSNFRKFMGEQTNPGDSTSYTVPQVTAKTDGYVSNTIFDYFGLPVAFDVWNTGAWTHNALPLRAYNLIWNEWFRDENLQNSATVPVTDGPDAYTTFILRKRGKRHDYFTSCLPFLQKGTAVSLPLGTSAPIVSTGQLVFREGTTPGSGTTHNVQFNPGTSPTSALSYSGTPPSSGTAAQYSSGLSADLSTATAATINQIRQSFQIQKLLERDARGGTRYTELVRSHFGVISPDARLQRPEYLGGGSMPITFSEIPQTSANSGAQLLGDLAAKATGVGHGHGFSQSFTEHGYVIGLVSVRADLTYQQGMRKLWSRSTRYDFYWPVFAALGEQAVLNQEIYKDNSANDTSVFGYQERWAEYRYFPSMITGLFRSQIADPIDVWHLAQHFSGLPTLNSSFISDSPPVDRVLAIGDQSGGKQFLFDSFFDIKAARPLPMYSVPGMIDHF